MACVLPFRVSELHLLQLEDHRRAVRLICQADGAGSPTRTAYPMIPPLQPAEHDLNNNNSNQFETVHLKGGRFCLKSSPGPDSLSGYKLLHSMSRANYSREGKRLRLLEI